MPCAGGLRNTPARSHAFATATEPLPSEPGFQERIQSPDFREDWQQRLRDLRAA